MFYTQLFTSKRGLLAKIWLAAHWERKLTKAHVFECNLETTVRDILSNKMKIGLRTSGHLLLGVVRIYSRKTKYLLADCSEAKVKIKIAFRPGLTDLPEEDLEATVKSITLAEDFTSFDVQLPHPGCISNIDSDYFSLNQSRSEEITLKENFGNSLLTFQDIGDELQSYTNKLLDISFQSFSQHDDKFGDEDEGCELLDFLANSRDYLELTDIREERPENENTENVVIAPRGSDSREPMEAETPSDNQSTLLANEEEAFTLEPVPMTPNSETKRGKRKRKLLVDQRKQLSNSFMREQLCDYSDLVRPLNLAPPTAQLMHWKENGSADKLLTQLSSTVAPPNINKLLVQSVFQVRSCTVYEVVEEMRQQKEEAQRGLSSLSADNISVDSSVSRDRSNITEPTDLNCTEDQCEDAPQFEQDETRSEVFHPELPSEASLFVHPSSRTQDTQLTSHCSQSLLNSQDLRERRITRQSQTLLNSLKKSLCSSDSTLSLKTLCRGSTRSQAANTFLCFLILNKRQALHLQQNAPYQDVLATPGPTFHQ